MSEIIGHRGAAGLALENTMPSFEAAVRSGARSIEFDVHQTLDGVYVVCHDSTLSKVSDTNQAIKDLTLEALRDIKLSNGSYVPTLREVLDFARRNKLQAIVEYKGGDDLEALAKELDDYKDLDLVAASFNHSAMASLHKLRPQLKIYLGESRHPFDILQIARRQGAQGIDLNYKLLNPLTYLLARFYGLEIMAYTVNEAWAVRLIRLLYPKVAICTNYPDRFK